MSSKYCTGKASGKVTIFEASPEVIDNIKAPFQVITKVIKGWFVNAYTARRPDQECNLSNWDGYYLDDENPNSQYYFHAISGVNNCGTRNYAVAEVSRGVFGFSMVGIIPNGFSYEPWKQMLIIIDADNREVFKKEYPLSEQIKFKAECIDGCPKGFLHLKTNRYPGYCCVKCADTTGKINKMIQKL